MSNKKAVNFFWAFLNLTFRLNLELGIQSDCQFSAFMENDMNFVKRKCILKLLTSKNLPYHQKFKGDLRAS